jgi:hypothetical protein
MLIWKVMRNCLCQEVKKVLKENGWGWTFEGCSMHREKGKVIIQ